MEYHDCSPTVQFLSVNVKFDTACILQMSFYVWLLKAYVGSYVLEFLKKNEKYCICDCSVKQW